MFGRRNLYYHILDPFSVGLGKRVLDDGANIHRKYLYSDSVYNYRVSINLPEACQSIENAQEFLIRYEALCAP
jgi:hypothetical protein